MSTKSIERAFIDKFGEENFKIFNSSVVQDLLIKNGLPTDMQKYINNVLPEEMDSFLANYLDDFKEFEKKETNKSVDELTDNDYNEISKIVTSLFQIERPLSSSVLRTRSKDNSAYTGVINLLDNDNLIKALRLLGYVITKNGKNSFLIETMEKNEKENIAPKIKSNGIYSVMYNKWIKEPVQSDIPDINQEEFEKVFKKWEDKYFDFVTDILNKNKEVSADSIYDFIEDIYDLRKESMEKDGEYGIGNLVFKEMRNLGYLDQLKDLKNKLQNKELSLEGLNK